MKALRFFALTLLSLAAFSSGAMNYNIPEQAKKLVVACTPFFRVLVDPNPEAKPGSFFILPHKPLETCNEDAETDLQNLTHTLMQATFNPSMTHMELHTGFFTWYCTKKLPYWYLVPVYRESVLLQDPETDREIVLGESYHGHCSESLLRLLLQKIQEKLPAGYVSPAIDRTNRRHSVQERVEIDILQLTQWELEGGIDFAGK